MKRRDFIKGSLLLFGLGACSRRHSNLSGQFRGGGDYQSGHLLREKGVGAGSAERSIEIGTAILGGGISGLSAAWKLTRSGWTDFEIFELEAEAGGNSRSHQYAPCRAPWAAHYLPVPTQECKAVRELLREMKLIRPDGTLDERHLCHPLQERLWYDGTWHESLVPGNSLSEGELEQWNDFQRVVQEFTDYRDKLGRKAFALPLARSSPEAHLMALDAVTFGDYARARGWTSPYLTWILDYACRDDYGAGMDEVSAWAGLHYFCARDDGGFPEEDALFVWPEGNARIVDYLKSILPRTVKTRHLILSVQPGTPVLIDLLDLKTQQRVRVKARNCIYALPSFQRKYHFPGEEPVGFHYAPWVTANLTLRRAPQEVLSGFEPAWDNVIYQSPSLGYVVADHQVKAWSNRGPGVWTWYRSFPGEDPVEVRKRMLTSRWEVWKEEVLSDLEVVHSDIREVTENIDIALFGHGMITPIPGHIWGEQVEKIRHPLENVWFAHSDLSGISIFEEAQYRGVLAAQQLMTARSHSFEDSLQ